MHNIRQKGFTLIELLVVIAIIGILSSVVLASLNDARQKSRDARRVSDINQLKLALELYYDSNGNYPTNLAVLATNGHIAAIPTDPQNQTAYAYCADSGGTRYHLATILEQESHSALENRVGANSTWCDGGGINATDNAKMYDVTP